MDFFTLPNRNYNNNLFGYPFDEMNNLNPQGYFNHHVENHPINFNQFVSSFISFFLYLKSMFFLNYNCIYMSKISNLNISSISLVI